MILIHLGTRRRNALPPRVFRFAAVQFLPLPPLEP